MERLHIVPAPGTAPPRWLPEWAVRGLAVLAVCVGLAYLWWRAAYTLNEAALWLALPLFLAECHAYATFLLYAFMTWDLRPLRPGEPPPLSVDIFIPTYNESPDILAVTIAGATMVRGEHTTYVLDDGRRDWVRELCDRMKVQYIARPTNEHAKAGNINHAMQQTTGDVIVILDADHVPSPAYLEATLGYFADPAVAVVQGPQEFYNRNSFQHADPDSDWHEQTVFYKVMQPGKNRTNSVFWCGSPSVVRRAALEDIGGVATETVTEDLHTSIRLQRAGWRIVYHNETIARGIAPEDYNAFVTQRFRWAQGSMQVIRREAWKGGLAWPQRLNYIASTTTYFDAFRKFALLTVIPAILFSDHLPVDYPAIPFLVGWSVFFVITQAANVAMGRGYYRWLHIEMFDLLKMFAFIRASITLVWESTIHFKVTPKALPGGRTIHPLLAPLLGLGVVYAIAIAVGLLRLAGIFGTDNRGATIAAVLWGLAVTSVLFYITWRTYLHVNPRRAHRLSLDMEGWCKHKGAAFPVRFRDMSLSGVAFITDRTFEVGDEIEVLGPRKLVSSVVVVRRVRRIEEGNLVGAEAVGPWLDRLDVAFPVARALFSLGARPELRPVGEVLAVQHGDRAA